MEIVFEQRRWMDIVIEQWCSLEEAKQKKARKGAETSLQQPQHHSQRKLTLSNVLFQFLLGVRRGHVGKENAL